MGLGIVVVEICDRNRIALEPLEELETKYPEAAVLRTNCLNMCNLCRARPFAMVNETRVYARTVDECIGKIEEVIREELEEFFGL